MEPPGRTAHIIQKDFYFERASAISSIWEEEDSFNALRIVAVPSHSISLLFSIIEVMTFAAIGPQEPFSMMATFLFWKFNGAAFIDAGNIWTLRNYPDQPGGQFKWNEFYKQIAVAYGLGLRLNLDYFVLRFDAGMKAVNPAYETSREHYPIMHPSFSRDFSFHFAVGLPF